MKTLIVELSPETLKQLKPTRVTDEEVWLRTFLATAHSFNADGDTCRKWADRCVTEFRKRFPK